MVKKVIIGALCAVAVLCVWVVFANDPVVVANRLSLGKGSGYIHFDVSAFGCIPVADMAYRDYGVLDEGGVPVRRLGMKPRFSRLVNAVYSSSCDVFSYVDENTMLPLRFVTTVRAKGISEKDKDVKYDHLNLTMTRNGEQRVILPRTYDPLSLFWMLSRQDFEVGREYDFNLNTNQSNYQVLISVKRRREISVRGKKFALFLLQGTVKRRNKSSMHSSAFSVWYIDAPVRAPLVMNVFSSGIFVQMRARSIE
jgi:hypothetical protein